MENRTRKKFVLATEEPDESLDNEVNDLDGNVAKETMRKDRQHKLSVVLPPVRARSPVTVQEWVAALPDHAEEENEKDYDENDTNNEEDYQSEESEDEEERDTFTLGAEAGYIQPQNAAKLLLASRCKAKSLISPAGSNSDKRGLFQHTDTAASLRSNFSVLSSSSVASVLHSREADPEEVLLNLGFGKSETLAKIPARFLKHKSKAKGITVDTFIAKQEDLVNRFESGSFGYRGLQGSASRRPSAIVEKILHTLNEREKELRRKNSTQSWITTSSFGGSAIPSRFRLIGPHRKTFESIVEQVSPPSTDLSKAFKSFDQSMVSPGKKEQKESDVEKGNVQRNQLVFGQENQLADIMERANMSDTELSDCVSSSISDNSDWSDEEREKLEKIFGAMSERGEEWEKIRHLRRSRRQSRRAGLGSLSASNWDIAKLVYSRDSSISGLTASSLNSSTLELDRGSLHGRDSSHLGNINMEEIIDGQ